MNLATVAARLHSVVTSEFGLNVLFGPTSDLYRQHSDSGKTAENFLGVQAVA